MFSWGCFYLLVVNKYSYVVSADIQIQHFFGIFVPSASCSSLMARFMTLMLGDRAYLLEAGGFVWEL